MDNYDKNGLLHEMFIKQAKTTPDSIAVVQADGKTMTYRELDKLTEVFATNLQSKGVGPDKCVGIFMDKTVEYVVAYIGVLRAGGAYLPLDVSYPDILLANILQDACPPVVIVEERLVHKLKGIKHVIVMKRSWETALQKENEAAQEVSERPSLSLDNVAYIVYSSGTTGQPKGIVCPHRGAVFSYHARHMMFPYQEDDREACNVFFVWELLRPLLKGVPLYIIPTSVIYDPPLLCDFLQTYAITRMLFTPSLLEAVLNTPDLAFCDQLKALRTIIFCGEVVTTALFQKCKKLLPWIQFVNLYSVSECHDVAYINLNDYFDKNEEAILTRKFCPVGKVVPGVQVVIMDDNQRPQPVGSSGEIYIGGPTLAHGYLNRPEVQAQRFIPRPNTVPSTYGDTLYKSGDWGYILSDGCLEICGRCDSMVKIRGYSIEIQAVEAALMELSMVHSCVVLVKGEEGENKFLVTYIVPNGNTTKKSVREELKKRLPFYMIPSYFVFLSKIPVLAASGKLDKAALPPFDEQADDDIINEGKPKTETEIALATIWSKVLQLREADINESFFDLGGHSLLAAELINQVKSALDIKLSVQDLFYYPTISLLGQLIDSKLNKTAFEPVAMEATIDLETEVTKYDSIDVNIDMQLRAFWRTFAFYNERRFENGRVLLTGSTGFLGAFILRELLVQTKTFIFCLVRELPDASPADRIRNVMIKYGFLAPPDSMQTEQQKEMEQLFMKRVMPIKGDVALLNLGVSDEDYAYMYSDIDMVIHAAASVNLVYPYNALSGTNVTGTSNIIQFACKGKIKPIHYISTDAVFPNGLKDCQEDDNAASYFAALTYGYAQTKWVAEQLIRKAGQRGLPVTIYRLGNMSGDSGTAKWNTQDFTLLILQACVKLGKAPDVDWMMEMTPVDFAAKFVVKMTKRSTLCLGKTFHVINDKPLQSRLVFEWMKGHGYPVKFVPFDEWRNCVLETRKQDNGLLYGLLESYIRDASFFSNLSSFSSTNLQNTLAEVGMTYPYIDAELLQLYFTKLSEQGIIASPQWCTDLDQKLKDRVVIVTGASSGIGKAIAIALAGSGAKVAMAARRTDKLAEVASVISEKGGVSITIKADVTKKEEVNEMVKHTEMTLGPVSILVNNAGTMCYTLMKNLHLEEWDKQIEINVKGLTNCIGAVLDGMVKRGQGHIVNMSSDAGRKGFPGLAVYSGTKFYVEGLSQAMRQELSGTGVKVTCIQPGDVKTELLTHTTDKEAQEMYDGSSSCKILETTDIANAVLYAVTQPDYVGVNEILIEPREAPA